MKFKRLLPILFAAAAISASAQGYKDGIEYFKADQFDNAKELLLRNLNNADTDKALSNYFLGRIAMLENAPAEAEKYFNAGIAAQSECPYNYVGLGEMALKKGDTKEAERRFKEAEKYAKKDLDVKVAIARAYYNVNPAEYGEKISKLTDQVLKKDKTNADVYIFLGDIAAAKQDWGDAAGKYEMAINYHPDASEGYVKYAILHNQINPAYTISMLEKLVQKMPNSALGQRELAKAYYNSGRYADASDAYGKYVQNPNHFKQDEDQYAFLLFFSQDFKKGYDYATQLLKTNPGNFTAQRFQYMNAAQLPEMKDQLLQMAESLWTAHKSNSKNRFAPIDYNLISSEFQMAKRYDEAEIVLEEAIKEMPKNDAFPKALANLYLDQNQIAKAADAFTKYMEMQKDPSYNDMLQQAVYYFYAAPDVADTDTAAARQYYDKAIATAKKISAEYPDQYRPYKIIGDVKIQQAADKDAKNSAAVEDYKIAAEKLDAMTTATQQAVNDAKIVFGYLGNYYLSSGDTATAKSYFAKYLKFDPNDADFQKYAN